MNFGGLRAGIAGHMGLDGVIKKVQLRAGKGETSSAFTGPEAPVNEALLPCPHCGSQPTIFEPNGDLVALVKCLNKCNLGVSHPKTSEAIAAWNRRAPMASGPEARVETKASPCVASRRAAHAGRSTTQNEKCVEKVSAADAILSGAAEHKKGTFAVPQSGMAEDAPKKECEKDNGRHYQGCDCDWGPVTPALPEIDWAKVEATWRNGSISTTVYGALKEYDSQIRGRKG